MGNNLEISMKFPVNSQAAESLDFQTLWWTYTVDRHSSICECVNILSDSAHGDDCHSSGMLRQQYDTSAVVSARAHGFCSRQYSYEFFLQADTLRIVSTHQSKEFLTE